MHRKEIGKELSHFYVLVTYLGGESSQQPLAIENNSYLTLDIEEVKEVGLGCRDH